MKQYYPYLAIVLFATMSLVFTMDYENQIEDLENQLEYETDSLNCIIDSMQYEIDTLIFESEIWDYNIQNNTTYLLSAIMHVESRNNDSAYCAGEDAVGCLQIRKTMVNDINRILKRQGSNRRFYYEDRWNRYKSIQMFDIFCKHYNLNSAEEIARCWNGGPRGINKPATNAYWKKVQEEINS